MEGAGHGAREKRVRYRRNKKACIDCTNKCVKIHKKSSLTSDTSSFFKVMLGDFSQIMYIPPAFAQTMTNLVDTNIFLEDSFGACWRVQVCMKRSLAFGDGWCNFVLDHSIDAGEFLVFRKVSQSIFSVQIFSTSGCERLNFCKPKKISQNKRKRTVTILADLSRPGDKNDYPPTIQEVTRREEKKARRTNAVIRRLIMEDIADKGLILKEELPIIPPIATMPCAGPLSLCFSKTGEKLTVDAATCSSLADRSAATGSSDIMCTEINAEINGTTRKFEAVGITTGKKYEYGEAKNTGEVRNFIHENSSFQDDAAETETGGDLLSVETEIVDCTQSSELKCETFTISACTTSQS